MEARKMGISIIYQELSLMNELSVMENIYMCNEPLKFAGVIDFHTMQRQAETQLNRLNAGYISAREKVGNLSLPQKQLVEIAKALALECKVLIMDEPTTSLTDEETAQLFDVINMLKAQGITIIYISHRMNEIFQICDTAIVMRDGKLAGTMDVKSGSEDQLIDMMTGKLLNTGNIERKTFDETQPLALELSGVSDGGFIQDLSMKLYEGEVLGIGGLVGSKRTELFRMICGIDPMKAGVVKIKGSEVHITHPGDAIRNGIGYLSENRKEDGLSLGMTIEENNIHCDYNKVSTKGVMNWRRVREIAERYIQMLKTKGRPSMNVVNLSGGNQQKVSIAKWLHAGCSILVFDEPTRGIDVGAKAEIHNLIREFASQPGNAAIVISSDANELMSVSDRVVVMSKGKVTGELKAEDITQNNLTRYITQGAGVK
ncbi:MAG: sugar ABC transporter ATP-binding protein [Synergistaceae bacterium]|nr:sugar ABC transporter ATP-binding protein [Synergistaceae bacterium]